MKYLILTVLLAFTCNADAKHKVVKTVPAFSAKSFIVATEDGTILQEQDSNTVRPIASISKMMIALLASEQDLDELLSIPNKRQVQSSIPRKLSQLKRKELLTLALVRSDNFAAQILCNNIPDCIERMNSKAQELGMLDTSFEEPTGLSKENVSTAQDLLKLLIVASINPTLGELSRLPNAEIISEKKLIKIRNTNPLTNSLDVIASKTGYTKPAGGCLIMSINSEVGQRMFILLGSKNGKTRIPDMLKLVKGI